MTVSAPTLLTGQTDRLIHLPTNSTHVSTVVLWNRTDTFTSFAFCASQATRMSLTRRTKILTGYGRREIWKSKLEVFKILQSFCISGRRRISCIVQGKVHFPTIHTQETPIFWHQILLTVWGEWIQLRHFIWTETDSAMRNTWPQLTRQYQNWQGKYKDLATKCIWRITSPPQTYSMTWPRSRIIVVAVSDTKWRACHSN